jgi:hypothetical protein
MSAAVHRDCLAYKEAGAVQPDEVRSHHPVPSRIAAGNLRGCAGGGRGATHL